ncbi:MAG: hypothetical protein KDD70_12070 [Bdellovibrionales bacterium]|nr:hypothetical protein [Bdellovibrionales bacterium]
MEFIVSGGVSSTVDLERLRESGAQSVIIGKAIYEGKISLEELKNFLC